MQGQLIPLDLDLIEPLVNLRDIAVDASLQECSRTGVTTTRSGEKFGVAIRIQGLQRCYGNATLQLVHGLTGLLAAVHALGNLLDVVAQVHHSLISLLHSTVSRHDVVKIEL